MNGIQFKGSLLNDLLVFYFARKILTYRRSGILKEKKVFEFYGNFMKRMHPSLHPNDPAEFNFSDFKQWFKVKNGGLFDPDRIHSEVSAPLPNWKLFT